ncbi:MAG: hypothetical protein JNL98_08240 [Bryobacterales bacterium]|nr:hypothetical protein [Bryobacterales bacterium]
MRFLCLAFLASSIYAAPPVLTMMEPWGAQRGKAVTLTLAGSGLMEGAKIVSTLPAVFTPLTPPSEMPGRRLPFLVELKADAPVGLYPIRIESAQGISNVLLFSVGVLPETREAEHETPNREPLNDTSATAQEIKQTPIVINGTLRSADRDFYKIYGKAGEKRVFEVEARRMGSAIDPSLRILDASGKLLARVEDTHSLGVDCRIEFTFPREGHYFVEVQDARFSDQAANFYRLKMGYWQYADSMFPLGGKRGAPLEVELSGGNLTAPVKTKVDWSVANKARAFVNLPGNTANLPLPFAVSDAPEMIEPASQGPHLLPLGTVVNGRIAKPGEKDRYKLVVQPGETYTVELQARELGATRLDGVLTVRDRNGKRLQSAGDQPPSQSAFATILAGDISRDPFVVFTAPKDSNDVTITVDDLSGDGGPAFAYRLLAKQEEADFELTLLAPHVNIPAAGAAIVPVNVERRGYAGAVQLSVRNLPEDLRAAGGYVPAEVQEVDNRGLSRRGVLTLEAKPGVTARALELEVWGEAVLPNGKKIVRKAGGPGMVTAIRTNQGFDPGRRQLNRPFQAPWLGMDLPAMVGYQTAGHIEVFTPPRLKIIQGEKQEFYWKFHPSVPGTPRPDTATPDTPGGRDLRISDRVEPRRQGAGMIQMNTTIGTPPGAFDVILSTRVGDEVIYSPAVRVEVVQGYSISTPSQTVPLHAGASTVLAGTVTREAGFAGPVTVAPDALPLDVNCAPVEVPENSAQYQVRCEAGANAPHGEHMILLNPASILPEGEKGKVPYKIAPVEAKLVIVK